MDDDRIESLIVGYLTDSLSPSDWEELKALVDRSPEARQALVNHILADHFLRETARNPLDADRVLEVVTKSGQPEFTERLLTRIATEPGGIRGFPKGKHPTHRSRKHLSDGRDRQYLVPVLVAAGLLFGLVLFLSMSSSGPSRPDPGRGEATRREREKEEQARKQAQRNDAERNRAKAEKARQEAETALAELLRKEKLAEVAKQAAAKIQEGEHKKKADEAFVEAARKRKDEEAKVARLRAEEEAAKEAVARATPEAGPREKPVDPAPAKPTTQVVVAKVERVEGNVNIVGVSGKVAAKGGDSVLQGQGLKLAGPNSFAVLVYSDKTRLEAGSDTELQELLVEGGKRVHVARGEIRVAVSKQPKDEAMLFTFRDGEATVLGTTLRIVIDPDPTKGTRLDVEEGKVRLKNLAEKTVLVESGHYAVAAAGVESTSKRCVNLLVDPGFESGGKGWQMIGEPGRIAVATSRTRWGSKALQLSLDPKTYCRVVQDVRVLPGASYDISTWIWSDIPAGASAVSVSWWNASGAQVGREVPVVSSRVPQSWGRFAGRVVAPAGASRLRLEIRSNLISGTAWFDDCEVIPVER
ncbi:MAG: FecR domain-containing protein [Acidobacteria bacterium]|nr:FecR domain-containing protein [Acidobacteriota bacterium]